MKINGKLTEECAIFGVCLTTEEVVGITYNGLLSLQHRGQEGAGIAVVCDGKISCHKEVGLTSEVFSGNEIGQMPGGKIAVGHARYSTTGGNIKENVGPFVTEYLTGRIATAHNGNITNAAEIRRQLKLLGLNFDATCDSEVVSSLIAYWITKEWDTLQGVIKAANSLNGAFSLIIASSENKLIAVRDSNGYRPLCIGHNNLGYAVASESCALEACGFEFVRDVLPGEVIIAENGEITYQDVQLCNKKENSGLCIFEYVYFARPDSIIDGLSVYEARYNMGTILAEEYPVNADVGCGVPDSGLEAPIGYSSKSGIPLVPGFVKNRYIGRSFIYPTQVQRDSAVRLKLNPLSTNLLNKRVVLVDDSIVRGTTSEKIVRNVKNAGAKEVHLRISSPPFRYSCHYGTDIDNEENLIANKMSLDEICRAIGADSLGYISKDGLINACAKCRLPFCTSCFTGNLEASRAKKDVFEPGTNNV
jgi:amidophosphoribosyltransferase